MKVKSNIAYVLLLLSMYSAPLVYGQPYVGKLAVGYERFSNPAKVSGDALIFDMKLLEPTLGVSGGVRYERVTFPGYSQYNTHYIYAGMEKPIGYPAAWLYGELGFNTDEFFHYWPVVYPDYYLTIGACYRFDYLSIAAFARVTRIIDGVGIPSGYFPSYGFNFSIEIS